MQVDVIDAKKTAMIVVDMQNDFVASGAAMETPEARTMVPKLAEALNICREAQVQGHLYGSCAPPRRERYGTL
jgi:biuret amidohydrolase